MADEALPQIPMQYPTATSAWPVTIKQLILVVGLAATVAAAVAVILWSQSPSYTAVHAGMDDRDAAAVVALLQGAGIPHRLENGGTVMVPGNRKAEVRLLLAEAGLPRGTSDGMERFGGENFGQTPFMETALFNDAKQTELARTIMQLSPVQGARVHLAVPQRSVFLRDRQAASASVMLQLFPGRVLDQAKVAAVVHLVASSVPELEPEQVTVVDQRGNLLTSSRGDGAAGISATQMEYAERFERRQARAIEEQLSPVLGASRVRATVAADLDFTVARETQKTFDPNNSVVISEEEEQQSQRSDSTGPQGIPGALANQPPETAAQQPETATADGTISSSTRRRSNFDVDETFREIQLPTGTVRRLSVAVVIDNKEGTGSAPGEPRTEEELAGLTELAKQAVGFDETRGDTISVLNYAFLLPEAVESVEPPPIWQQPWVWDIARQLLGVMLVLLLALFVVKPIVQNLTKPEPPPMLAQMGGAGPGMEISQAPVIPQGYDDRMAAARTVINQDPRQVAQVMRNWVAEENE